MAFIRYDRVVFVLSSANRLTTVFKDANQTVTATTFTGFLGDSTVAGTTKIGSTHAAYTSTYYFNASTVTYTQSAVTNQALTVTGYTSTDIITEPAYCPNPNNYSQQCTVRWGDNQTQQVALRIS